jgi:hypothetical protein
MTATTLTAQASGDLRDLHKDQRGAIMLMGLCMSCFLIGGLWFLIGMGDTIVFRDQMQEATDHAAFMSSVLHAKGMNFISACNLILLAIIAIHILMGIIHDILLAVCITTLFGCIAYADYRPFYTGYFSIMTPVAKGIHFVENLTQIGYPFIALAKAYQVGNDYGNYGPKKHDVNIVALSTSLVPGNAMSGVINKLFNQHAKNAPAAGAEGPTRPASAGYSNSEKGFLPVEPKHFDSVCEKIVGKTMGGLSGLIGLTGKGGVAKGVMGVLEGIIGGLLKLRYCNDLGEGAIGSLTQLSGSVSKANKQIDAENQKTSAANNKLPADGSGGKPTTLTKPVNLDTGGDSYVLDPGFSKFWGKDGPFVPWAGTSNGSAWQQVWALNIMPSFDDPSQHRVHIGANNKSVTQDAKAYAYLAQSEYFYDCAAKWTDEECDLEDNAGYGIKWRARLHRFQLPQVGSLLSGFASEFLTNLPAYTEFKEHFGKGLADKFGEKFGGVMGVAGISGGIEGMFKQIEDVIGDKILGPAGELINKGQNGLTGDLGMYH